MHRTQFPSPLILALGCFATLTACGGGDGPEEAPPPVAFADRCAQLVGKTAGAGTISATNLRVESADGPQACVATGTIASSTSSAIKFLIELPVDDRWNQNYLQLGGAGYNGTVSTVDRYQPWHTGKVRQQGFVIAGSDSGHSGTAFQMDWAVGNPSAFDNFAFNAHPQLHAAALDVIRLTYAREPARKYFWGFSTGGREALLQAQRYPDHYDGIVAGMPVVDYSDVNLKATQVAKRVFAPGGWLSPAKVTLFTQAQLQACDTQDGLADGTISNWQGCRFDPAALRCPDGLEDGDDCLSDAQLATVAVIRERTTLPVVVANGISTTPGYGVGEESGPAGWASYHFGTNPAGPGGGATAAADEWIKYVITGNPALNSINYVLGSDAARWLDSSEKVNATNPDISAFLRRGGKLLMWHGASDYLVPPGYSLDYYGKLVEKFGQTEVDRSVRLYILPSVTHLPFTGAGVFDQVGTLRGWVEEGKAPDSLVGYNYAASPVAFSRPLCRYPSWPKYDGSSNVHAAASFRCVIE